MASSSSRRSSSSPPRSIPSTASTNSFEAAMHRSSDNLMLPDARPLASQPATTAPPIHAPMPLSDYRLGSAAPDFMVPLAAPSTHRASIRNSITNDSRPNRKSSFLHIEMRDTRYMEIERDIREKLARRDAQQTLAFVEIMRLNERDSDHTLEQEQEARWISLGRRIIELEQDMRNRTPLSKHAFRVLLLVFVALIVTLSVLLKVLVLDRGDSDPCLTTDVLISSQASMDTFLQSGCTVVRNLALVNLSPEGTTPLETSDELHLLMSPDQDRAVDAVPLSRLDYWQSKIANTSFSANRPPIDVAALNYNAPETDARAFMLDAPAWMLLSTALANLHTISGDFSVVNCTIRSLRMTALTSVGGSITIRRNPSLVSLYMPVLQQGAGNLEVAYNPFLLYMYFPQLVQLENMAILAQMSLPKLDFPMLHSISELSITWQPYLHNISFGQLNTADNVKLIMLYTSAFGTESCELHFPSMTYTQSLLVKNVYQLGKLDVTSLAQASYLDFSTIFMGKTRVLVSSDSDENVTQVLVGDEHFTFPSLVTSDLTISFSNVFGCIELNFPSLLTCAHFALASNTFLSTVNMPALVTADELDIRFNPNLVNVSAPILRQVTSAFFLVANWALKRVLFPDLQEATVLVTLSYDLENITLGLTRGSVAIVSNPVLKAISLPRLDAVAMLAILDNLVLESISLPVLTTVGSAGYVANSPPLGLAWIIGHENILDNFPPNRTASDTYEIGAQLVSGLLAMWANPQLTNFSAPLANYAVNVFVQNNPSLCFDMDTLPSLQTLQVSCLHGNRQGCLGAAINNTLSSCNTPPAPSSSISSRMVGSQPIASAPYSAGSASMLGGNSPVRWRRQGLRGV